MEAPDRRCIIFLFLLPPKGASTYVSRGMSAIALRGRKLRTVVAGIRVRRRTAPTSFGQTCQIEDVMGVILKTCAEMTLAGVEIAHVTPRQ
jgi:hypothetical protein